MDHRQEALARAIGVLNDRERRIFERAISSMNQRH